MDIREKIKKVAVLGAGDMGHGIAEVCAIAGYEVWMRDIREEFVERGMARIKESLEKLEGKGKVDDKKVLSRLHPTTDLEEAVKDADIIIEAIPEVMDLKKKVFSECDEIAKPDCIFASNTSSMSITELAKATEREDKFLGLHFFNPVVLMRLVEVIRGEKTGDEAVKTCVEFVKSIGKTPVVVRKDVPGFIANRVVAPGMVLLFSILEKGIATPEEIDATMRKIGLPIGPCELADYTGLDVNYHVMKYYEETVSPDYKPPEFLEKMVKEGNLGKKAGKGLYDWSAGRPQIDLSIATDKVNPMDFSIVEINEACKLVEMCVADPEDIDTALKLGYSRPLGPFELAKSIGAEQIEKRLEELAKQFGKKIFEPAEFIKSGKLKAVLEENQ
ncbi:3-hydroxyacyl-CoA dehydrogenase [Archaeoglobus sp.]|uniref:3-hydroxyacyl-CoA dehydrogenase n=1 Tax=Archaeoglobus sp. TaxID=1872626 RepID=UPI0025BBDEC4|nr:3-hydroxyacyl-CoA dehydrogenase [Archaeoglobus sp.]